MEPDGGPVIEMTALERAAVEATLWRRDLAPHIRERLEMVQAAAQGHDLNRIVASSGRTPATVRRWLNQFRAGGIAGLADAPRSGRPLKADAAYMQALERAINASPRALGLPFDVWTSGRLSAYLGETTGTRVDPGWLRTLLARRSLRCRRPKHTLDHIQRPAEVAA